MLQAWEGSRTSQQVSSLRPEMGKKALRDQTGRERLSSSHIYTDSGWGDYSENKSFPLAGLKRSHIWSPSLPMQSVSLLQETFLWLCSYVKRGTAASEAATVSLGTNLCGSRLPPRLSRQWAQHRSPWLARLRKTLLSLVLTGWWASSSLCPYRFLIVSGPLKSHSALHSVILGSFDISRDG